MKRLTGYDYIAGVKTGDLLLGVDPQKAFDKLAAYEDTGLEPEELLSATDMAKVACALHELNAYKDLGPIDRIRELALADQEGRCVVLACKPSDVTVYQLRSKKHARGVGISPRRVYNTSVWGDGHYALHHQGLDDCLDSGLGKTWFLTKEEAEAALREAEG